MPLDAYTGSDIRDLMTRAERAIGPDAVVIHTRRLSRWDGGTEYELLAGDPISVAEAGEWVLTDGTVDDLADPVPVPPQRVDRPGLIMALVGPTGAGKTTTIAKLAAHPRYFGNRVVGLITLDTYRVAAVEQLRTFAEIARLPLEVVHDAADAGRALRLLAHCEVVLIDTPGHGPRGRTERETVRRRLALLRPDEVHLVVTSGCRAGAAEAHIGLHRGWGLTHVIATKTDEYPDDWSVFEAAARERVPMRWCTDGQEVPSDIRPARPRLQAAMSGVRHVAVAAGGAV